MKGQWGIKIGIIQPLQGLGVLSASYECFFHLEKIRYIFQHFLLMNIEHFDLIKLLVIYGNYRMVFHSIYFWPKFGRVLIGF